MSGESNHRIDLLSLLTRCLNMQLRYVHYVEDIVLRQHDFVSPSRGLITSISLHSMPHYRRRTIRVAFIIECFGTIQYDYGKRHGLAVLTRNPATSPDQDDFNFEIEETLVAGDVTIRFYLFEEASLGQSPHADIGPGAATIKYGNVTGRQLLFVSFHTSFHGSRIIFSKSEVDGAYDKPNLDFLDSFAVTVDILRPGTLTRLGDATSREPSTGTTFGATFSRSLQKLGTSEAMATLHIDTSKSFQSVPYGIMAGPRLLRLFAAVERVMVNACPEVLTFARGQLIYNPEEDEEERSIYMIVSGNDEDQHRISRINRGDSLAGLQIGAGEFYGELKFLLGNTGDPSSFCLLASSESVQVIARKISSCRDCFLFLWIDSTHSCFDGRCESCG